MARPPGPPPSRRGRRCEPRPHCAGLPAFHGLRRLRAPAPGHDALPRLEACAGHGRAGASGPRRAGRRSDRRPRRRAPPRRIPRPAQPARRARGRLRRARAHRVSIDRCPILAPGLSSAIETAWAVAEVLTGLRKPLDIQVTATDAGLDVDIRGSGPLAAATMAELARVAERRRLARLTRHGEIVAQRARRCCKIGRARLLHRGRLPAGDRRGRDRQRAAGGGALRGRRHRGRRVLRGRPVRVAACRARPRHRRRQRCGRVAALQRAAAGTQGLKPIDAAVRDLFRRPLSRTELKRFDAMVFDRRGRARKHKRARSQHRRCSTWQVAVSCNPATSRATPASSWTAATVSCASRRSISSSIRRMWSWWRTSREGRTND